LERDQDALVGRNIYAGNTSHGRHSSIADLPSAVSSIFPFWGG